MNEQTIFTAAMERPSEERSAYLDEACGSDEKLRQRIEHLLHLHDQAGSFLEPPAIESYPTIDQPITEKVGTQIGPYKIREQIGEGGFGVVFVAEQTKPVRRKIALKVIKPGMDTKDVIARFEAERQAVALMDHPNVARVLDAGTTESGRPYFAMELVQGVPITEFCDEQKLSTEERLQLFFDVCQAVQHAHQKGIIHRDIKPLNVMVTMHDHKPVPKVIDFGVAKAIGNQLTEKTIYTAYGQMVGTPMYMSPEQAQMSGLDVDTRSDVYSLGVLLYELLTGTTPFDKEKLHKAGFDEMRRIIREDEPPRPSDRISTLNANARTTVSERRRIDAGRLGPSLRGELDWIVMKALEKDRERRYETASKFAEDVQHYLNDEAVLACPPSRVYQFRKFARRNKGKLVTIGLVAAAILMTVGTAGWAVRDRAAQQAKIVRQQDERQQRMEAQVELLLADIDRLAGKEQWDEALATARRAEAVLSSGDASQEIGQEVEKVIKELLFVNRLNDIRNNASTWTGDSFDYAGAVDDYRNAFQDFGANLNSQSESAAINRLKRHPRIAVAIAGALDEFANARRRSRDLDDDGWRKLVALARALDEDPLRNQLRSLWGREVTTELQTELRELVASFQPQAHCANTSQRLARILGSADMPEVQEAVLRRAEQQFLGDYWLNLDLGNLLDGQMRPAEALPFFGAAVGIQPKSTAALNNLGTALNRLDQLDAAANSFRKAIELDPHMAFAHNNLGVVLRKLGDHERAITCFRTAIEIDPGYVLAHQNLGQELGRLGQLEDAIDVFYRAIELTPENALLHYDLGVIQNDQERLVEAAASWRKAIELDPNLSDAYINLGITLRRLGRHDEAIATLQKLVSIAPDNAEAHFYLSVAFEVSGQLDEAIETYHRSIELAADDPMSHWCLGNALKTQDKPDAAIAAYRKAIEVDPDFALAHNSLGVVLKARGNLEEAMSCYRTAIEVDPVYVDALRNLGNTLRELGQLREAITVLRKAIELAPESSDLHNTIGHAQADLKLWDEAIASFRKAIELAPGNLMAKQNLAVMLARQGERGKAIHIFEQILQIDPEHVIAQRALRQLKLGENEAKKSAEDQYKEVPSTDKSEPSKQEPTEPET